MSKNEFVDDYVNARIANIIHDADPHDHYGPIPVDSCLSSEKKELLAPSPESMIAACQ